jgi:signal transduction histidine kinase/CheY-like chemotaxis protein
VEAVKRGYSSVAAIPLNTAEGAVLGVLAMYSEEVDAFDDNEMKLLGDLANDLAYGIRALRGRAERLKMAAQLQQADRMVAVGTLAAGVAHEINNPLAYVVAALGFLDEELSVLARELPPGRLREARESLSDAHDGAGRVTTIVRDLKTFSRADEERSGPVDLHRVIDSSINLASNAFKHRAQLVKDYGRIPQVLGNEARLGQVFLNLLINSAQAFREGSMERNEIRVTTRTDDAGRAIVEVGDTGIGMTREVARHVFDPFFTTKPVGVGTGLGLFICRNIVAAAGGEISIDSEPGRGTVLRVALPPAPAGALVATPGPAVSDDAPRRRGWILVVDDEPAIGTAVQRALQAEHDVVVMTTAREARERIASGERFDAIVCDLMMPLMTGMDLHRELTTLAPDQAERMVFLTGGAFTTSARQFLESCRNGLLEKPVTSNDLRALVRALIATPEAGAAERLAQPDARIASSLRA